MCQALGLGAQASVTTLLRAGSCCGCSCGGGGSSSSRRRRFGTVDEFINSFVLAVAETPRKKLPLLSVCEVTLISAFVSLFLDMAVL